DAPVSGGQAGAENGKLTIMVGGEADVFARAEGVLAHYARAVTLMGGPGSTPSACSTSSAKGRRNPGRWTIAARRWLPTSSTLALPSTGCARISRYARPKRGATVRRCR